jgi:hypothetical protein
VANQAKESDAPDKRKMSRGYSSISHTEDNDDGNGLELCIVGDGSELEEIDEELLLDNLKVEIAFSFFLLIIDIIHLLLLRLCLDKQLKC